MAIRLDISKTYDKVEWSFIWKVLLKLEFHSHFVDLVLLCVSSVSYSIILSGRQFGHITPRSGLRQGDPLSPYLFLLCMDVLTSLISKAESNGDLWASGQEVNLVKSVIAFSRNTPMHIRRDISEGLGIPCADKHEKYLGLPLVIGRSKRKSSPLSGIKFDLTSTTGMSVNFPKQIDLWIPENSSFKPSLRLDPLPPPTTVDQLFASEGGHWNVPLIESTFPSYDDQTTLSIPIGRTDLQDDIIRHHTKSGSFSVKSTYHLVPILETGFLPPKFVVHSVTLKMKLGVIHSCYIPLAAWFGVSLIFNEITASAPCSNTTSVSSSWCPPEGGFVKINYDAALFLDIGDFGIGIIARDHNGNCLAWLFTMPSSKYSPEIAEVWATRAAINLGCRSQWDKIVIEGDCANLVMQLVNHEGYSSSTEVIILDICAIYPWFLSCSFSLVRREGNSVAHSIARSAIIFDEGRTNLPPHCIEHLLADMPSL
ncbi:UNVERIFIED_CONTAM: putative mitochondrial protein [Sesamum radiatum]|uniref:Mitochondrial protein n=1 Tax=Sesamum radiatum TaxID=300843 RepID=A0AAW2QIC1_SESRA